MVRKILISNQKMKLFCKRKSQMGITSKRSDKQAEELRNLLCASRQDSLSRPAK